LSFYPYNKPGNGIAVGLENIQKTADGPALGGVSEQPEQVFDAVDSEDVPTYPAAQPYSWM
jgi:hypothetical protein